jgi:hypothetical protein
MAATQPPAVTPRADSSPSSLARQSRVFHDDEHVVRVLTKILG